jgi:hypothetical protein
MALRILFGSSAAENTSSACPGASSAAGFHGPKIWLKVKAEKKPEKLGFRNLLFIWCE